MFFLQAAQAPIPVRISPEKVLFVPPMLIDDLAQWGAKIALERSEQALKDLPPEEKAQHLTMYPYPAPDINELKRLAATFEGANYIVRTQLAKAKVMGGKDLTEDLGTLSPEEIEAIIKMQSGTRVVTLGWVLGQMNDTAGLNPFPETKPTTADKKDGTKPNPLA